MGQRATAGMVWLELRANRGLVRQAVALNGNVLKVAVPMLQLDREVVLAAVAQNGHALKYAAPVLQADREVVLAAVAQKGCALEYAAAGLRADRHIVRVAVAQDGGARRYVVRACAQCGVQPPPSLKKCSQCRTVFYCGNVCQHMHWRDHKGECRLARG